MKIYYNYLLLIIIISYFIFLFSRVVLERIPVDPLFLTALFCIGPFFLFLLKATIKFCYYIYIKFYAKNKPLENNNEEDLQFNISENEEKPKNEQTKKEKMFNLIKKFNKLLISYFEKEFIEQFFMKNKFLSKNSLRLNRFITNYLAMLPFWLTFIAIVPWLVLLGIYFYELIIGGNLLICLYLFSFNTLIRKLIDLSLYLAVVENEQIVNKNLYSHYMFLINTPFVKKFFLANNLIKNNFLFYTPKYENNTRMLKIFWLDFQQIAVHNFFQNSLNEFIRIDWFWVKKLTQEINLIIFSSSLLILILNSVNFLNDFIIVNILFFASFLILIYFLIFLEGYPKVTTLFYRNLFKNLQTFAVFNYTWLEDTYDLLLQKNIFSKDEIVVYNSKDLSIDTLHKERFENTARLTDEEFEELTEIQLFFVDWCYKKILEKKIDFETFSYIGENIKKEKNNI